MSNEEELVDKKRMLEILKPMDACLYLVARMNDQILGIKRLYCIDELEYKIYFTIKREDGIHCIQLDNYKEPGELTISYSKDERKGGGFKK